MVSIVMRILLMIGFSLFLFYGVNAQDTLKTFRLSGIFSDSTTIRIHQEIPPEFDAASQVNEYYSEVDKSNHFNVLKLRADCMFVHEIHYKPYNSIIRRDLGTYRLSGDTIYLADEPYYNRELSDTIIQTPDGPVTYKREYIWLMPVAVPWDFGPAPSFLVMHNDKLYASSVYSEKKQFYFIKEKTKFEIRECK